MTEIVLLVENLNFLILLYILLSALFSFNIDLRPRSHINNYFPPTALSYLKLPTYVDAYKNYLCHIFLQNMILLYTIYI